MVLVYSPGPVHTPLQPASRPEKQMEGFGEQSQLGRPGQPSEIAPSYIFLASAEAELYSMYFPLQEIYLIFGKLRTCH